MTLVDGTSAWKAGPFLISIVSFVLKLPEASTVTSFSSFSPSSQAVITGNVPNRARANTPAVSKELNFISVKL